MYHAFRTSISRKSLTPLAVLFLITIVAILPIFFSAEAADKTSGDGLTIQTQSHRADLSNYDIRMQKGEYEKIAELRSSQNVQASKVADVRDLFTRGESKLRERVPSLKIEYNVDIRIPEIISPDVKQGKAFLTAASTGKRSDVLKEFLKQNESLLGATSDQIDQLKVFADYSNPEGELSWVELNQEINGIPVFRGEVKAGFTKNGEVIRVVNNFAPGLDYAQLSTEFNDPVKAVAAAAQYLKHDLRAFETNVNKKTSNEIKTVFGEGDFATTAEKMYFPLEPGVALPAWRVLIRQQIASYYVIVDAASGELLWRKNLTEDQTQPVTYNVYVNPNAMINVADSPFPLTPGPADRSGIQGAGIPRALLTRVGNEAPFAFNNLGWITDGNNTTDGNNVQAGLDRALPNSQGPVNPNDIDPNGVPTGSANRVFNFPFNPAIPTNPNTDQGESPLPAGQVATTCLAQGAETPPTDFQKAAITQLFYISNVYHDEMYRLGFTEQARNFQNDNFGRGGLGGDRVSAQAQDCSGSNNANFSTPADGTRGSMQMYLWTNPNPDIDGSLDADVIIHELTHGTSNRLHGNSSGLGSLDIARGMGEGWSDFYGHAMLSEPSDPINGIYTTGGYDTYRLRAANPFHNYYYGIRRFPKAVMASTGGPNNRPHNPLTFADIDSTKINVTDGAFGPGTSATADGPHAIGEVWSSALWEIRARMVTRLGWEVGNRKVLQLVTDGMKLAPLNPTPLTERDAIVAAALGGGTAEDVADIWAGFAIRGMGTSASIQNLGGISNAGTGTVRVTEAFDLPNLAQTPAITVDDADGDGFAEPGELLTIAFPLTNLTGINAANVNVNLANGSGAYYGPIAHGATVTENLTITVPSNSACGSVLDLTFYVTSSLGPITFTRKINLGQPQVTFTENFDGVTAPGIPAGWTVEAVQSGINFVTSTTAPSSIPNSMFALDPTTVGGGTNLTSPDIPISVAGATVSFRNNWDTEDGWDGGVLEISIAGGVYQDILAAGGSFTENGYNGSLGSGSNNPLALRSAWTGNSGGYVTTTANLPPSAIGQNVRLRWRFGADNNTAGIGWNIDNIEVRGNSTCSFAPNPNIPAQRSDFDGDGRTDYAVFRGSDAIWYIDSSTSGFAAYRWGLNGDTLVPGDYDGDGKTDAAVFRGAGPNAQAQTHVLKSNGFLFATIPWGVEGDVSFVRDFDGDNKDDLGVYRASHAGWYIQLSSGGEQVFNFGTGEGTVVAGEFDGDGKADVGLYKNGLWTIRQSSGGTAYYQFGLATDKLVPADYDGDGIDDLAVFRPSNGYWWIACSSGPVLTIRWGIETDVPVPGDYDGDGKADVAVFRGGDWYVLHSDGGFRYGGYSYNRFGLINDIAVTNAYLPR